MLDAALMRPGRFDQAVYVPPPDENSRFEIMKIHTKRMPLSSDVDLLDIARRVWFKLLDFNIFFPLTNLK